MKRPWLTLNLLLAAVCLMSPDSGAEDKVGFLYIESDPPNARLVIDGNQDRLYQTPVLCTLAVGAHRLTLSTEFHQPNTVKVVIAPRQVLRKKIRLVATIEVERQPDSDLRLYNVPGELTILTDIFGVSIFLDDVRISMPAPVTLPLVPSGLHAVRIEHNGLFFDTLVAVKPAETTLLELRLRQQWGLDSIPGSPELVALVVEMDLPACRYQRERPVVEAALYDSAQSDEGAVSKKELYAMSRRYEVPQWDDTATGLRGVDPNIRIITPDTVIVVSHRPAVDLGFARLPMGHDLDFQMPSMVVSRFPMCPEDGVIRFEIEAFVNQSEEFYNFLELEPIYKQFRVPADFNGGADINVRIQIDPDGEIHFRYW